MTDTTLHDVFNQDGLLKQHFEQYQPRPTQVQMAELVQDTLNTRGHAVIEGETGVGKSFGYLVPILLSGKQAIISTSNKNLQDQLSLKDLPTLKQVLPFPFSWVVLKGKNNYFCTEHFISAQEELMTKYGLTEFELERMAKWAHEESDYGDMDFYPYELDPKAKALVCCDKETEHEKDAKLICYAKKARELAMNANVVLVNHSLLALDLALKRKSEGKAKILPNHPVVVMDEAHAFEHYATLAFSIDVSMASIYHLLSWKEVEKVCPQSERSKLITLFKQTLNRYTPPKGNTGYYGQSKVAKFEGLEGLVTILADIRGRLARIDEEKLDENHRLRLKRIKKEIDNLREKLISLGEDNPDELRWSDAFQHGPNVIVTLHSAPLDISWILKEQLFPTKTVVATSATLTSGGSFTYFRQQMGMPETTKELVATSPFDYKQNCLVYVTDGSEDKIKEVERLLLASKGRAFVLFTSYKEMQYVHDYVNIPYPKLIQQGTRNRRELLEQFKETENAVLFATKSFWEGIDVQGEQLSMVIIDKLPFGNPYELVYQSKQDRVEKQLGRGKGFSHFAVPEACIAFKQGIGRLIRSTADRGVIAILDSRIAYKPYGKAFIRSLPQEAPRTQQFQNVEKFFAQS